MGYVYEEHRERLFTDKGQKRFLEVRDKANALIDTAGAFRADKLPMVGDSWTFLACLDRMLELEELVELSPEHCWGQYRVFTRWPQR